MNIAHVFECFGNGGAEEHAMLLADKAKESGNKIIFVISKITDLGLQKLQKRDIKIIYLSMKSSFNPVLVRRSAVGLKKIVESEKIDIVHTHMLREQSIAIVAKLLGGKFSLIRTFHRFDQFNWKMKPFMAFYYNYTDAFISISPTMSDYLKANGLIDKITLIQNGSSKVDAPSHKKAIGFIGRLAKEKGVLKFIQANVDLFRDIKLVIAGDGPEFSAIESFVRENKLNVELMGNVLNRNEFFKKISVYVLPSETEVLPLVILEAYSCGLPVVAFNIESLKNLIKKENGVLVGFPNYKKLGQVAVEMLSNSESYRDQNIKVFNQKYSADIMWGKTRQLYESASSEL